MSVSEIMHFSARVQSTKDCEEVMFVSSELFRSETLRNTESMTLCEETYPDVRSVCCPTESVI